jgi:hypothetical protein
MEHGYVMDYVETGDYSGSRPLIYVRKVDNKRFASYEEYAAYQENAVQIENSYDLVGFVMYGDKRELGNKVRIDGTSEGYFEYVILQMYGGQFNLGWHANYDDALIICDQDAIENTLKTSSSGFSELFDIISPGKGNMVYMEMMAKAKFIDFQPVINIGEEMVIVKVITFTKWGGFIQYTFTINKDYPHTIIKVTKRVLIDYQCGISF